MVLYSYFTFSFYYPVVYFSAVSHSVLLCFFLLCLVLSCGVVSSSTYRISQHSFNLLSCERRSLFSVTDSNAKSSPDLCAFTWIQILIKYFHMRLTEIFIFLSVCFSFQSTIPSFSTSPSLTDLFPHFLDI